MDGGEIPMSWVSASEQTFVSRVVGLGFTNCQSRRGSCVIVDGYGTLYATPRRASQSRNSTRGEFLAMKDRVLA